DDPGRDRPRQAQQADRVDPEPTGLLFDHLLRSLEGLPLQEMLVLADGIGRARPGGAHVAPHGALDGRKYLQPNGISKQPRVPIRGIATRPQPEGAAERLDLGPPDVDQGLDLSTEGRLDPPQGVEPSAPDEGDQDRLRLVVEGVTLRQALAPNLPPDLGRVEHAHRAPPRLDRLPVLGIELADAQMEWNPEPAR